MAVDNPSYFSLRNDSGARSLSSFFRKSTNKVTKSSTIAPIKCTPVVLTGQQHRPMNNNNNTSQGHNTQRRGLRNLFRSASMNTDSEKTKQFLKGEPRPSDVAPPSPYLNGRLNLQGGSVGRRMGRRYVNRNQQSELLTSRDLPLYNNDNNRKSVEENEYYCYDRDSECSSEASTLPVDDLEDKPRDYYNVTGTLPNLGSSKFSSMGRNRHRQNSSLHQRRQRRHSIGTFADADGNPRQINHSVPSESRVSCDVIHENGDARTPRNGTRHVTNSIQSKVQSNESTQSSRDDVIFISSKDNEAATLWVNYLTACFEQISRQQGRPPFRVFQFCLEDTLTPNAELRIRAARLQIIIVCPILLERVTERPEQSTSITRQLSCERVLAMMLGVQDNNLNAIHRSNLVSYQTWRKFFAKDQDETFVGQFFGAAVSILGNNCQQNNNSKVDKIGFSVHPKKVKLGQNRILALLNEPLNPDDTVSVTVDRCGEALEVNHVKRRNPYTLQFSIPERCLDVSMLVGVRIARNGAPLGIRQVKCESRLRELDQILRAHDNPLEFMCQTFGFNSGDKEQLDNWMVHAFQKNIPPHFNLLSNPTGDLQLSKNQSSSEENPTLLHFAARFGLEKLAWQLLECPGSDIACDMKNVNDLTPAELAEQAGHLRLAHQLRGYMQMNEFTNMYSYLKIISEGTNGNTTGFRAPNNNKQEDEASCIRQEDYCRPRPLSEAYSVPPAARPVTRTFPDYSTPPPLPQPNNSFASVLSEDNNGYNSSFNASNMELPLQGYMQMNPAGLRSFDSASSTPTTITSSTHFQSPSLDSPVLQESRKDNDQISTRSSLTRSSSSKSRESPQDELLEIITDFKNNVFTIAEVEQLVENWRNRNDVQQSFKDKQRQLAAMRDEYERIQKRMKDEMKTPTPFDRFRKLFTKGKKDSKESASPKDEAGSKCKQNENNGNLAERRPVSSLSLHSVSSSSSSGRMSTVSGCSGTSLGDSGTHSDTDDRRHQSSEDKNSGMSSYEIPPAPKPYHGRLGHELQNSRLTTTPNRMPCSSNMSELDVRPVKSSVPANDDKEYYIAFPPSGLPVHSFKQNGAFKEPKTPTTPVDTVDGPTSSKFNIDLSYANIGPLTPPPGMCIPFEYVNINIKAPKQAQEIQQELQPNILTIQPEIHPEPANSNNILEEVSNDENENVPDDTDQIPQSPKILNTDIEEIGNDTEKRKSSVAASDEIAKNFGITLKKPGPPVPPRSEFTFITTITEAKDE